MTHILKISVDHLERRLNKKIASLDSLTSLAIPNAGISVVEDCSTLSNVESIDLSGNQFASDDSIAPLLKAPKLSSLDISGCPVCDVENFRRWVIASSPCLTVLNGKDVSALERRYAYNLFPELKAKAEAAGSGGAGAPAAGGKKAQAKREDDLFGSGVLPVAVAKPAPPKDDFFSMASEAVSPGGTQSSFFSVTPMAAGARAASPGKQQAKPVVPQQAETFERGKKGLYDNDILKRHEKDAAETDSLGDFFSTSKPAPSAAPAPVEAEKVEAPRGPPPPAPEEGKHEVLDNDVVSGKSFLDQKTAAADAIFGDFVPSTKSSASKKVQPSIDVAGMFFEGSKGATTPAASSTKTEDAKAEDANDDHVKIVGGGRKKQAGAAAASTPVPEVEFGGPREVRPVPAKSPEKVPVSVETYSGMEELGESVSYGVEQICGYIMRAFRPRANVDAYTGLFEFSVVNKDMSPDTFYVRVSSQSGVSVHAGHVPAPEQSFIDCKLSLSEAVMNDMLNGRIEPGSALLSGKMNVQGEMQKLFLFRDVFRFALSRFNLYQKQWDECVQAEEKQMAELARGNVLEDDFSAALEYLMSVWKGYIPDVWGDTKLALVLISQLPDNVYYKGYKARQKYFPPQVLLKMTKGWVEMVPFSKEEAAKGDMMCEIYGKKSIIRSVLTGSMSLRHVLNLLSTDSETQYRYSSEPYVFDANTVEAPPFLHVRNMSPARDGTNDFEHMFKCFDVNVLSYDRFLGEKKVAATKKAAEEQERRTKAEARAAAAAAAAENGSSPVSASSPSEWMGKLKGAKDDFMQKINNASSPGKRFDMDDIFGGSSAPQKDSSERELVFIPKKVAQASETEAERGFGFTPSAGFQDYEI